MTNSLLSKNEGRFGGGVFVGTSTTTTIGTQAAIDHSSFLGNTSSNIGGGLYANNATTAITVTNSAFSDNTAVTGGGIGLFNTGLRLINSSLTGNTATNGGGLFVGAGPAATDGKYAHIESVTFSGNTASSNQGGGVLSTGRVELYSTTIVNNAGGGVYSLNRGNTRFRDTVLQNPGALNCGGDGTALISDDTHNFSTDSSCVLPSSRTGVGLDPKLGPLTLDPNGLTSYYMPLAGSPLIDAGFNCLALDQRGASRVNACDIGTVEFGGVLPRG